jgi:hypothetical protein
LEQRRFKWHLEKSPFVWNGNLCPELAFGIDDLKTDQVKFYVGKMEGQ